MLGFHVKTYEQHVANAFLPIVDAARHMIVTCGYVVVVALTAMFTFHVAGWTLCRCLGLRLVVPVSSRRLPQMSGDSSVETFIRRPRLDVDCCHDDDDDDDASDYDDAESSVPHLGAASVSAAHARRYDSSSVAAAGCSLSGYSETNV